MKKEEQENYVAFVPSQDADKKEEKNTETTNQQAENNIKIEAQPEKIEGVIPEQAPKKNNNKLWIIIASAIAAVVLLIASVGGYFLFFKTDKIDIFDYLRFDVVGANTHGTLDVYSTYYEGNSRIEKAINDVEYDLVVGKDGALSNGDEVKIYIDQEQAALKKNKIVLVEDTYSFTVSGLITIPNQYADIKNPEILLSQTDSATQASAKAYKSALETSAKNQFGEAVPIEIDVELVQTWFQSDQTSKSCNSAYFTLSCGSVAYVYKLHANVQSDRYYLTDPDIYVAVIYSAIHYDADEKLQSSLYTDFDLSQEVKLANIEEKIKELGFERV